jgi:hypothetical protein
MSSAGWSGHEQSSTNQSGSDELEGGVRGRAGRRGGLRAAAVTAAVTAAAVVALTGCTSASAAGTSAQGASTSGSASWHIVKRVAGGSNGVVTAVTAAGQNGGWAFDGFSNATAWERNGSTWTRVPFPSQNDEMVVAAAASSASNVWAFTQEIGISRALRWNGRQWTVTGSFPRAIGGAVVLGSSDVWVFGTDQLPGVDLGAWHYNGRTWSRVASGHGLEGGSGRSASDIWAFDGADVAHWNGSIWSRTSVASLLPPKQQLNDPFLTGIFEQSRHSVYAIANGNAQDEGGPIAILHWNGSAWSKVAGGSFGFGMLQQLSSDGHGGLWLPMPGSGGQKSYLLHYSGGHLTQAALPGGPSKITVDTVALIPGTTELLGGGDTHAAGNPGAGVTGVVLQYGA